MEEALQNIVNNNKPVEGQIGPVQLYKVSSSHESNDLTLVDYDILSCPTKDVTPRKSKGASILDSVSGNSSDYESAASTKSSSTNSMDDLQGQSLQKTVSPTLLENALKVVKNLFSPEKKIYKPVSASTPTSSSRKINADKDLPFSLDVSPNEIVDQNKQVDDLGAMLSSLTLGSHNNTDDSYTTTVSRIDDSFQSTVTHFDDCNRSGSDQLAENVIVEKTVIFSNKSDVLLNDTLGGGETTLDATVSNKTHEISDICVHMGYNTLRPDDENHETVCQTENGEGGSTVEVVLQDVLPDKECDSSSANPSAQSPPISAMLSPISTTTDCVILESLDATFPDNLINADSEDFNGNEMTTPVFDETVVIEGIVNGKLNESQKPELIPGESKYELEANVQTEDNVVTTLVEPDVIALSNENVTANFENPLEEIEVVATEYQSVLLPAETNNSVESQLLVPIDAQDETVTVKQVVDAILDEALAKVEVSIESSVFAHENPIIETESEAVVGAQEVPNELSDRFALLSDADTSSNTFQSENIITTLDTILEESFENNRGSLEILSKQNMSLVKQDSFPPDSNSNANVGQTNSSSENNSSTCLVEEIQDFVDTQKVNEKASETFEKSFAEAPDPMNDMEEGLMNTTYDKPGDLMNATFDKPEADIKTGDLLNATFDKPQLDVPTGELLNATFDKPSNGLDATYEKLKPVAEVSKTHACETALDIVNSNSQGLTEPGDAVSLGNSVMNVTFKKTKVNPLTNVNNEMINGMDATFVKTYSHESCLQELLNTVERLDITSSAEVETYTGNEILPNDEKRGATNQTFAANPHRYSGPHAGIPDGKYSTPVESIPARLKLSDTFSPITVNGTTFEMSPCDANVTDVFNAQITCRANEFESPLGGLQEQKPKMLNREDSCTEAEDGDFRHGGVCKHNKVENNRVLSEIGKVTAMNGHNMGVLLSRQDVSHNFETNKPAIHVVKDRDELSNGKNVNVDDDGLKILESEEKENCIILNGDFFLPQANKLSRDFLSDNKEQIKCESEMELAELIQQQFSVADIEHICKVIDDPAAELNRKILRASQQFDKTIQEKNYGFSEQNLDFLDHIQGPPSLRDLSRESLYVKFDPLVAPSAPHDNVEDTLREIERLKVLYLQREAENKEITNAYENEVTRLTGQKCVLEDKLKESHEREKALAKKVKEQAENIDQFKLIMDEYCNVMKKLTSDLKSSRAEFDHQLEAVKTERDTYMTHLNNIEAAFTDVHSKYEKSKKTIESYRKNEIAYKNKVEEQRQRIEDQQKKIKDIEEISERELVRVKEEVEDLTVNHRQELSRLRAQLRKTELKLQAVQESLEQKIKENEKLTVICDDLIEGKK